MCGIFGIYSPAQRATSDRILAGLKPIIHRGPDNQNTWISDDFRVGLGHARLGIIDLSGGNQPIANHDGSIQCVVNGEFYDYEGIRDELIAKGHRFKTQSDSEIVIHLYAEYGIQCIERLRGEFSFLLWDNNKQELIAVRDRFGVNPLYYTDNSGELFFGSEIKALLGAGIELKWDQDSYAKRSFFYQNQTLFEGINQLPPGHCLIANKGGYRIIEYWDIQYQQRDKVAECSESEMVELVREALLDATQTRLKADVPVGVYLSGGVDSCAVLGMAAEFRQHPIDTFTLCFDNKDYDERDLAQKMAQKVGANHHEITISQEQIADNFFSSVRHSETLCMNAHGVAKFLLSKFVHELDFRVVLTGEGADELFAGYSSYRLDLLNQSGDQGALAKLKDANQISSGLLSTDEHYFSSVVEQVFGFVPAWLPPLEAIYRSLTSLYSEPFRKHYLKENPIDAFCNSLNQDRINRIEPVHASMYSMCKASLPNYVFTNLGDRMEMAHSLEGRLPFLDHKVAEILFSVPASMKIKGETEKYILREAVKPYLLQDIYTREKHPFLTPPSILNPKDKFHQLVQDTLRGPIINDIPFLSQANILDLLANLDNISIDEWGKTEACLMEMMSLAAIQHEFGVSLREHGVPCPEIVISRHKAGLVESSVT